MPEKSSKHLLFRDDWEYLQLGQEVYRVKVSGSVFDVNGNRMGARWECSLSHFQRLEQQQVYPFSSDQIAIPFDDPATS